MAKKDEIKEVVEEVVEANTESTVDETKPSDEIKVVEQKPIVVKEKFVTVKSKIKGSRFIGGTWYEFEPDKELKVTEDAKRILTKAGAIYL